MTAVLAIIVLVIVAALITFRATRWGNAARDRVEGKPQKPVTPGTWVVLGLVIALSATAFIFQLAIN